MVINAVIYTKKKRILPLIFKKNSTSYIFFEFSMLLQNLAINVFLKLKMHFFLFAIEFWKTQHID